MRYPDGFKEMAITFAENMLTDPEENYETVASYIGIPAGTLRAWVSMDPKALDIINENRVELKPDRDGFIRGKNARNDCVYTFAELKERERYLKQRIRDYERSRNNDLSKEYRKLARELERVRSDCDRLKTDVNQNLNGVWDILVDKINYVFNREIEAHKDNKELYEALIAIKLRFKHSI